MENETCVKQPPIPTPDVLGLFTLMLSVPSDQDLDFFEELEEHISWFDTPVSMVRIGIEYGNGGGNEGPRHGCGRLKRDKAEVPRARGGYDW